MSTRTTNNAFLPDDVQQLLGKIDPEDADLRPGAHLLSARMMSQIPAIMRARCSHVA